VAEWRARLAREGNVGTLVPDHWPCYDVCVYGRPPKA